MSQSDLSILQKGLNFIPTNSFNHFTFVKDLHLFTRKLSWKKHFKIQARKESQNLGVPLDILTDVRTLYDLSSESEIPIGEGPFTDFKPQSKRAPPRTEPACIEAFLQKVMLDVEDMMTHPAPSNCTRMERAALRALEQDESIIIKPSDKGGNVVLMDRREYEEVCLQILGDHDTYERLPCDPTPQYYKELKTILDKAIDQNLISDDEHKFMLPANPLRQFFYTLPKIHKGRTPLRGRPIVSGVGSISYNIGLYVENILSPFVRALPSYTRDTQDLLSNLEYVSLDTDEHLASIDVEQLYSSIRHEDGLQACRHFLSMRGIQFAQHTEFVLSLLEFILTHNVFYFGGVAYHQLRGTAMGCTCAPSYANLLLGWWEATCVFADPPFSFFFTQFDFTNRLMAQVRG